MELVAILSAFFVTPHVKGLESDSWRVREHSQAALVKLGVWAWPELVRLRTSPNPEVRQRANEMLYRYERATVTLDSLRVLGTEYTPESLERFWTVRRRNKVLEIAKGLGFTDHYATKSPKEWDADAPWRLDPVLASKQVNGRVKGYDASNRPTEFECCQFAAVWLREQIRRGEPRHAVAPAPKPTPDAFNGFHGFQIDFATVYGVPVPIPAPMPGRAP